MSEFYFQQKNLIEILCFNLKCFFSRYFEVTESDGSTGKDGVPYPVPWADFVEDDWLHVIGFKWVRLERATPSEIQFMVDNTTFVRSPPVIIKRKEKKEIVPRPPSKRQKI
jgi:hypothetical protein